MEGLSRSFRNSPTYIRPWYIQLLEAYCFAFAYLVIQRFDSANDVMVVCPPQRLGYIHPENDARVQLHGVFHDEQEGSTL